MLQSRRKAGGGDGERFSDAVAARRKAMDYLARREYGNAELKVKLVGAGFEPSVAAATVEQLASEGLQDDRRFVENFLRWRIGQGKGPVRIRMELQQHGIDGPLIEECIASAGENWADLARHTRMRKFGQAIPGDFSEKARQMRFLQYRGFESDQIRRAVGEPDDS